ncbi:hypothetical protein J6590_108795 [Homalodisca vitripennis]|nr:hypothetical protein J6590_108795 [Homalodisca vitripennis]
MFLNWLFPQLEQKAQQFIFQQDGAPPHWHLSVRDYLNVKYPRRWIGHQAARDRTFITGLQEALSLPLAIFSYGMLRIWYFGTIDDFKQEITTAIQTVTPDMLLRVWNEFEYWVDIA